MAESEEERYYSDPYDRLAQRGEIECIQYGKADVHTWVNDIPRKRLVILRSDLGTGKSQAIVRYINEHSPESVLVITPKRKFAQAFHTTLLNGTGLPFVNYLHKSKVTGSDYYLTDPYLVIQINSINRACKGAVLEDEMGVVVDDDDSAIREVIGENIGYESSRVMPILFQTHKWSLVIIDEATSVLKELSSTNLARSGFCGAVHRSLETIVRNADNTIMCDADIDSRAVGFARSIVEDSEILFIRNNYISRDRSLVHLTRERMIALLKKNLQSGKNCIYISSSKNHITNENGSLRKAIAEVGLSGSEILTYTGDTKQQEIVPERDWIGKRLIIYNSSITVGIDFCLPGIFNSVFVYLTNINTACGRDIIQSIHRVRLIRNERFGIRDKDATVYYAYKLASFSEGYPLTYDSVYDTLEKRVIYYDGHKDQEVVDYLSNYMIETPWIRAIHTLNILEDNISGVSRRYLDDFRRRMSSKGYRHADGVRKGEKQKAEGISSSVAIPAIEERIRLYNETPDITPEQARDILVKMSTNATSEKEDLAFKKYMFNKDGYNRKSLFWFCTNRITQDILSNYRYETGSDVQNRPDTVLHDTRPIIRDAWSKVCPILGMKDSIDTSVQVSSHVFDPKNSPELYKVLYDTCVLLGIDSRGKSCTTLLNRLHRLWTGHKWVPIRDRTVHEGKRYTMYTLSGPDTRDYRGIRISGKV